MKCVDCGKKIIGPRFVTPKGDLCGDCWSTAMRELVEKYPIWNPRD